MTKLLSTFPSSFRQIDIIRGEGVYLYTKDGNKLLDATSGITAHSILGYGEPTVIEAIKLQLDKICHLDYKNFMDENRVELANLLLSKANHKLDRVYFVGSSGGEACEAAMKLCYQAHFNEGKISKSGFVSRYQSYHGSTSDTMSLGDRPNLAFYEPFFPKNRYKISEHNYFRHKEEGETLAEYAFRSAQELEDLIIKVGAENIAGFIGETTMGGLIGDVPPAPGYWSEIRRICTKYDVHLIIDEVWCGTGTSGKIYSIDYDEITPDFIFIGKTLGAGYIPVSALITSSEIERKLRISGSIQHSTTHQGHSLSIAAALAVQKIIHNDELLNNVYSLGEHYKNTITYLLNDNKYFKNVRGRGLRLSIEYFCEDNHLFGIYLAQRIREKHGILVSGKWHRLSISPPLIIDKTIMDKIINAIVEEFEYTSKIWESFDKKNINNIHVF